MNTKLIEMEFILIELRQLILINELDGKPDNHNHSHRRRVFQKSTMAGSIVSRNPVKRGHHSEWTQILFLVQMNTQVTGEETLFFVKLLSNVRKWNL